MAAISDLLGRFGHPKSISITSFNVQRSHRKSPKMQAKMGEDACVFVTTLHKTVNISPAHRPPLLSQEVIFSGCPHGGIWDMLYIYIYSYPSLRMPKNRNLFSSPPQKKNGSILSETKSHAGQGSDFMTCFHLIQTSWRQVYNEDSEGDFLAVKKKDLDVVIFNWFIRILMMVYYNGSKTFILRKLHVHIYIYHHMYIYIYHHFKP